MPHVPPSAGPSYTHPMEFSGADSAETWPGLVPELLVTSLAKSLHFYVDVIGFVVIDRRADPEFAVVRLGTSLIMLGQWEVLVCDPDGYLLRFVHEE